MGWGWGYNGSGQATPPAGSDYAAIAAGWSHSLALKADGSIVGWGWNYYREAAPPAGSDYAAIAAGGYHSLALFISNTPPFADAGGDREVFARIDGYAEVTLDGSGSYDPDGDELSYLWSWTINSEIYEANGVTSIIELPVGEHSIQLIVNDGICDSEPNDVLITVIELIEADLRVVPRVINLKSRGNYIMAIMRLPEAIAEEDIDEDKGFTLEPGEIDAFRWRTAVDNGQVSVFAIFERKRLKDAVTETGEVELTVAGYLTSGQSIYGVDTVRVIDPPAADLRQDGWDLIRRGGQGRKIKKQS